MSQLKELQLKELQSAATMAHETIDGFHVDGVYINDGIRVVIYGEVTLSSVSRLEIILNGLLQLGPEKLTVEFETIVDAAVLLRLTRFGRGEIQYCALSK